MKTIIIDVDNHRQGSSIVPIGTEITVQDSTAAWLIEKGKAHVKPVSTAPVQKPASEESKK